MSSQKRNTQNLTLNEENSCRFYSWGLQRTVVKKSLFNSVLPQLLFFFVATERLLSLRALQLAYVEKVHPPLLGDDWGVVIFGLLILSYQSNCWQAGYDMGRGVKDLCWTCLETCLWLPKSWYFVSLYSDLIDQSIRRFPKVWWSAVRTVV